MRTIAHATTHNERTYEPANEMLIQPQPNQHARDKGTTYTNTIARIVSITHTHTNNTQHYDTYCPPNTHTNITINATTKQTNNMDDDKTHTSNTTHNIATTTKVHTANKTHNKAIRVTNAT